MRREKLILIPIKAMNTVAGRAIDKMISLIPVISVLFLILDLRANPKPIKSKRISVFCNASIMIIEVFMMMKCKKYVKNLWHETGRSPESCHE